MTHTDVCLSVCTRCRPVGFDGPDTERPGYQLATALHGLLSRHGGLTVKPKLRGIRCMSQCKRPCVVSLSAPGKFTLVFGDLTAGMDAEAILSLAQKYAQSPDGLIPRPERPDCLRAGILGRIPPLDYAGDLRDPTFSLPFNTPTGSSK